MNSSDQHTIDEYLLNRLDGEELKAFEQLLAQDESLMNEVIERRQLLSAMEMVGDLQMKERVKRIHLTEIGRIEKPPVTTNPRKWIFAFVLLLIASLAIWWVMRPKAQTPPQLYAQYYQPYDLNFGTRNMDANQALAEAGGLYKSGKYAEALALFEQALTANPADSKARLALGICQLELGQYDQALAQFNALMDANDPLFGEQAIWYAAMTKLQQEDIVGCKALLEGILSNQEGQYQEKAKELSNKLQE
ncbi:MAG: tetratricopeptide repeat protein [Saprospiraceae bacterium]|nr:tetratricopeptide repeat protein [Saprospiraceae bacterium]